MNPIYSAALQDHIAKKYSILGSSTQLGMSSIKHASRRSIPLSGQSLSVRQQQLLRWSKQMNGKSRARREWGTEDEYLDAQPVSLAQKLGVVPHEQMRHCDWLAIKEKSLFSPLGSGRDKLRHKHECPICQEGYANSRQILLSCGHLFHAACFTSWERLQTSRSCPLCRQSYHRLKTRDAHYIAIGQAALLIQTVWRRYRCRKTFVPIWDAHVPRDLGLRRQRLLKRLEGPVVQPSASLSSQSSVSTLFDALELRNSHCRRVIEDGVEKIARKRVDGKRASFWSRVYAKASARRGEECPICLLFIPIASAKYAKDLDRALDSKASQTKNAVALFSCSHYMHSKCFEAYVKMMGGKTCPCCRGTDLRTCFL
ncbi:RING finger protein 32 [Kappamyces sp. JEL0829]|nr:RING finger protein 32 [Kappamyces sp. JEL0829]